MACFETILFVVAVTALIVAITTKSRLDAVETELKKLRAAFDSLRRRDAQHDGLGWRCRSWLSVCCCSAS